MSSDRLERSWLFLTAHTHVLLRVSRQPTASARELAESVGITQRHTQRVVADLLKHGYIERERVGRRNRYRILRDAPLRQATTAVLTVGDLVDLLSRGLG